MYTVSIPIQYICKTIYLYMYLSIKVEELRDEVEKKIMKRLRCKEAAKKMKKIEKWWKRQTNYNATSILYL